ncbi:MAG TPA: hypothetical protein PLZ78_08950 [Spirochaetota bacterium]|nr:hypothetical protein [Spirochaetota bacterium]
MRLSEALQSTPIDNPQGMRSSEVLNAEPQGMRLSEALQMTAPSSVVSQAVPATGMRLSDALKQASQTAEIPAPPSTETPYDKLSGMNKFLDIIDRPARASLMAIAELGRQFPKPVISETGVTMQAEKPLSILDVLTAAKEGLTSTNGVSSRDIANELWKKAGVEGVPGLGLATTMVADPLNIVAGPIAKIAAKGTKYVGKGIAEIPAVAKGIKSATEMAKPATDALKKMFSTSSGIPQLDNLIQKYKMGKDYLADKAFEFGVQTRKVIENIADKYNMSIDDISKEVVNLIEQPDKFTATIPETKVLSNTLKSRFENILTEEMKQGLPVTALSEGARGIRYFPRITTEEARQYLKQAQIGNAKVWNPKLANALQRKTGDFTLEEFNQFAKANGLESLGGKSVEQFFMNNPAYAVAIRGTRSAKAVSSAGFLNETGTIFGKNADVAPKFWEAAPESLQKIIPNLKNKRFDPEILSEITRVHKAMFDPETVGPFLRAFDKVQNYWKAFTLAPFPKFHIRNMVGNVWNNYLADVTNPNDYLKSLLLQTYEKTNNPKVLRGVYTEEQARKILSNAKKYGVLGKGFYGADIARDVEKAIQKPSLNPLSTESYLVRGGRAVGTTLEENARLAHFINKVGKGLSPDAAALSVKKYLFDYGDLTQFEKQVMKRLFPFYTWTRKNLPLQVESILTQPQKYLPEQKMLMGRDQESLNKLKEQNPDLYERFPAELSRTDKTRTYVPLEGILPSGDLTKMFRPQEAFMELLNPYVRTPIELAMNKSFYNEKEIEKYDGETQEFLKMDIPVKWKYAATSVLPQARILNEINKLLKKKEDNIPLTNGEQAFAQTISSVYKTDLDDLQTKARRTLNRKIQELKQARTWANRKGRTKEADRITETISKAREAFYR